MTGSKNVFLSVTALLFAYSLAASAMGMEDKKMMMAHENMGNMHMMAAKCMKSGKSHDDCHAKMMKECKMGEEKCKMMMSMMDDSTSKMMMDDGMMPKEK